MGTSFLSLILWAVFLSKLALTAAQPPFDCLYCIDTHGNYSSTSAYSRNLKILLSSISSNTQINHGFYNFSVGKEPDKVYGIGICRGDLSIAECRSCINDATTRLPEDCPTQKEAIGYYIQCMVRYSNRSIFGMRESTPNCTLNATEPDPGKSKQLAALFDGLRNKASTGDSRYKFATGVANITASRKLYAVTQCNPDLSPSDCDKCLQGGISELQMCCTRMKGAEIYGPSCNVRFENYLFFNLPSRISEPSRASPFDPSAAHTTSKRGKGRGTYKTWIIVVSLFVLFILLATLFLCFSRRRLRRIQKEVESNDQIRCVDYLEFDFSTIQVATDNFSDAKRLGKCSSSRVYKGMLPNGQEIAVKRLCKNGRDGELEFRNEVLLSANLQHRNLVKLLGFCIDQDLGLLVYEFLPNESLDWFLNDPVKRANLEWETRHKIILGIARGLLYLHEDSQVGVIHRDLKSSNIILGAEMNPKISNFSKASRQVHADQTTGATTAIRGTYGYMPPEYVHHGHFSIKSDVFSFGVVLLEIISGQMISNFSDGKKEENLLSFAWSKWSDGTALDVMDKTLVNIQNHINQILRCIKIALLCVQENPTCRPTMSAVVFMLSNDIVSIAEPSRSAFIVQNNNQMDESNQASTNEASISKVEPR